MHMKKSTDVRPYTIRLKRARVLADRFAERVFEDAALSLDELDGGAVSEHYALALELRDLLYDDEGDVTDDEKHGSALAATADAYYILGVAIGRRLGPPRKAGA